MKSYIVRGKPKGYTGKGKGPYFLVVSWPTKQMNSNHTKIITKNRLMYNSLKKDEKSGLFYYVSGRGNAKVFVDNKGKNVPNPNKSSSGKSRKPHRSAKRARRSNRKSTKRARRSNRKSTRTKRTRRSAKRASRRGRKNRRGSRRGRKSRK